MRQLALVERCQQYVEALPFFGADVFRLASTTGRNRAVSRHRERKQRAVVHRPAWSRKRTHRQPSTVRTRRPRYTYALEAQEPLALSCAPTMDNRALGCAAHAVSDGFCHCWPLGMTDSTREPWRRIRSSLSAFFITAREPSCEPRWRSALQYRRYSLIATP